MYSKTVLIGHVGGKVDSHTFDSGTKKATFSIATSERYKKDGEVQTVTTWHVCELWQGLADIATKYIKKGMLVTVEGVIAHREYEKDGIKRSVSYIKCNELKMLSKKESSGVVPNIAQAPPQSQETQLPPITAGEGDDLPF